MRDRCAGVSPASSTDILLGTLRTLEARGVFGTALDASLAGLARSLGPLLPSRLFPDIYLEQPLAGDARPRAGFALDAFERAYLCSHAEGACLDEAGIAARTEPAARDLFCGVLACDGTTSTFAVEDRSVASYELVEEELRHAVCVQLEAAARAEIPDSQRHGSGQHGPIARLLQSLAALPLRLLVRAGDGCAHLTIVLPRGGLRARFDEAPWREELVSALAQTGVDTAGILSLARACVRCGIPCDTPSHSRQRWVSTVDVSHFSLSWRAGRLASCTAGVRISDRTVLFLDHAFRPTRFYQWHITDNCDQRCRHCYLFAEDARKRCVSTPFPQLLATLDQVERRSARLCSVPFLAITGGDPLLHPRFWDFAEELHRRGFAWSIMGNPFHLDDAVCRRLHELGCLQYQLSLDGRRAYHDSLRKPGSFDATLAAVVPLRHAGIAVQLMATASRQNLAEVLACMDLADQLGVERFAFARYCATSPEKAAELYPTPQEYRAFLLAYYEKRRALADAGSHCDFRLKEHLFCLLRYELGEFEIPAYAREHPHVIQDGCHLGAKATITADGSLVACPRMDSCVGNIVRDDLAEVEEGAAMRAYRAVEGIRGCADCKLLMWCRGCRAVGFNATGDLQAPDPMCWHVVPRRAPGSG